MVNKSGHPTQPSLSVTDIGSYVILKWVFGVSPAAAPIGGTGGTMSEMSDYSV